MEVTKEGELEKLRRAFEVVRDFGEPAVVERFRQMFISGEIRPPARALAEMEACGITLDAARQLAEEILGPRTQH